MSSSSVISICRPTFHINDVHVHDIMLDRSTLNFNPKSQVQQPYNSSVAIAKRTGSDENDKAFSCVTQNIFIGRQHTIGLLLPITASYSKYLPTTSYE